MFVANFKEKPNEAKYYNSRFIPVSELMDF